MHVQGLKLGELKEIDLNSLEVVVGEVEPEEVAGIVHHILQNFGELENRPDLVVLQEECLCLLFDDDFLLGLSLRLFNLASTERVLVVLKRDVVVEKNRVDLLGLGSADDFLLRLRSLRLFLRVLLVGRTGILVLKHSRLSASYAVDLPSWSLLRRQTGLFPCGGHLSRAPFSVLQNANETVNFPSRRRL